MQTMFCLNGKKTRLLFTGIVYVVLNIALCRKKKVFFSVGKQKFFMKIQKKVFPLVLLRFVNNEHSELFCMNSNAVSHMFE